MASVSDGWSTSFIYKQDLTSYYMNGVLRSVIRPGIYNANIGLTVGSPTVGIGSSSSDYLCLVIRKGTTFVFSNDYYYDEVLGMRRNFNHVTSDFSSISLNNENSKSDRTCLIKCVALSDMVTPVAIDYSEGDYSIHAFIKYDPNDSDNFTTVSPTFFLAGNSGSSVHPLYDNVSEYRYSSELGTNSNGAIRIGDSVIILDGYNESDEISLTTIMQSFYLNVGFVHINDSQRPTFFTGRGLPEYRYPSTMDTDILFPDMVTDVVGNSTLNPVVPSLRRLYFDIPETFIGTTIYKKSLPSKNSNDYLNWEAAYIAGRKSDNDEASITFTGEDTGVFAVYGLVSNMKSFLTSVSSYSFDNMYSSTLTFDKMLIQDLSFDSSQIDWGGGTYVTPLDISPWNVKRLLSQLVDKNIWSYVIDSIREEKNPNNISDIIPLGLVTVNSGSIDNTLTLSYLGLQNRMSQINVIDVKEHNIFNVIPIME